MWQAVCQRKVGKDDVGETRALRRKRCKIAEVAFQVWWMMRPTSLWSYGNESLDVVSNWMEIQYRSWIVEMEQGDECPVFMRVSLGSVDYLLTSLDWLLLQCILVSFWAADGEQALINDLTAFVVGSRVELTVESSTRFFTLWGDAITAMCRLAANCSSRVSYELVSFFQITE